MNTTVGEKSILLPDGFYHAVTLPVSREAWRHFKQLPLVMEVLVTLEEKGKGKKDKEEMAERKRKRAYVHGFLTIKRKLSQWR